MGFGSLIGFTAYFYLLSHTTAARAATYAYVNPVVAVLLGWAFAHEPLTPRTILAAAVILAGVAIITVAATAASTRAWNGARQPDVESAALTDGTLNGHFAAEEMR